MPLHNHDDVLEVAGLEEIKHVGDRGAVCDGEKCLGDVLGDEGRELLGGASGEDDDLEIHLRRQQQRLRRMSVTTHGEGSGQSMFGSQVF